MLRKTILFMVESMEKALKKQRVKEVERRKRMYPAPPSTDWGGRVIRGQEASVSPKRQLAPQSTFSKEKFIALLLRTKNFSFKNITSPKTWDRLADSGRRMVDSGRRLTEVNWGERFRQVNWKSPQALTAVGALALLLVVGGVFVIRMDAAYAVTVNGQQVAVVRSESHFQQLLDEMLNAKGGGIKASAKDNITLTPMKANAMQISSDDEVRRQLEGNLHLWVKGAVVKVNGQPRLTVANQALAEKLIKETVEYFSVGQLPEGGALESAKLSDTVEYEVADVALNEVSSEEQATNLLRNGGLKTVDYVVKDGDSLWTIARANDMLVKELKDANPALATERIQIGQKLALAKPEPIIHVDVVYVVTRNEDIPSPVKYETDGNLAYRQEVVKNEGEKGSRQVTYRIVKQNNNQLEQNLLGEKVLKEATPRMVARGPQSYATASRGESSYGSGSGQLSWPIRGLITSNYGARRGGPHTGIDIDLETGDAVNSAAGGTVTLAGWSGGYGKCVMIDHGDGLSTLYAHLSEIGVSQGQQVGRGEFIGRGGSTGNSTGSHLHFEVMVNDVRVNPRSYLN